MIPVEPDINLLKYLSKWNVRTLILILFQINQDEYSGEKIIPKKVKPIHDGVLKLFRDKLRNDTGLALLTERIVENQNMPTEDAVPFLKDAVFPYMEDKGYSPPKELRNLVNNLLKKYVVPNRPPVTEKAETKPVSKPREAKPTNKKERKLSPGTDQAKRDDLKSKLLKISGPIFKRKNPPTNAGFWEYPSVMTKVRNANLPKPLSKTTKVKWARDFRRDAGIKGKSGRPKSKS